ncbi:MAG: glycosyltransferase, partial [Synechococcaceae cyanobacterium]|nr:glycosyltransferase [Synechococcaceae cyanobacterium]
LLEAMAAGCTCVASACPTGPADLISPGVDGVLLPASAGPDLWASSLENLLANPAERRQMGVAAQAVRQRFDAAALGPRLLQTLAALKPHG